MKETRKAPIFIIGFDRSGTTLLRTMLDSHLNISSGPETRFLPDLKNITSKHWGQISLYGFDKEYWYDKIALFFDSFKMDYAQRRGKVRWAEKTPRILSIWISLIGYFRTVNLFIAYVIPTTLFFPTENGQVTRGQS